MKFTVSHGFTFPIVFVAFLVFTAWFIGRKGVNETIDLGQEIISRVGAEPEGDTAQISNDSGDTNNAEGLTPRVATGSTQRAVTIQVWDEFGNPVGNVCLAFQGYSDRQVPVFTNPSDGKGTLWFGSIPDETPLILLIGPLNHLVPNAANQTAVPITANQAVFGQTLCFRQVRIGQQTSYVRIENCLSSPFPDPYPSPQPTSASDTLPTLPPQSKPGPNTPVSFKYPFDSEIKSWHLPEGKTETETIEGRVFEKNNSLVFQQIFEEDFKMYRTTIPLERDILDFTMVMELRSENQPTGEGELGRFNIQFRVQDDGRYYNLSLDQTNVVTLYYSRKNETGERVWEMIDEHHLDGYDPEEGAMNKIYVQAEKNTFRVWIEGQPEGNREIFVDEFRFINQRGGMSLAVDGSADTIVSYELDYLMIHELLGD